MAGCSKFEKEAVETGKSNSKWPEVEKWPAVEKLRRWRSCGGGEVAAVENLETLPAVTVQAEREKFQRSKWSSWEAQGAVEKLKLPAGESERESGRAGERGSVCAFAFE